MDSAAFPLTVKLHDVVAAALPTQEHWLPMSNLDLLLPPLDFGIFLCYRRNHDNQDFKSPDRMVSVLKKALAETLVSFYPFAGEIVQNLHDEPEILCNNRGVDFVHACVDVGFMDLDLHHPDVSVHGRLVPAKMHGVLAVQVTELKCGGLVIGCTFDHRAADAHSANMFLVAWAEVAQSKRITLLPTFRRSLLNPRHPPQPHKSLDKFYVPQLSMPPRDENPHHHLASRIYYVKSEEIDRIQSQASCNGSKRSRIESFSAFLWKSIADTSDAHQSKTLKLGIVIDGRARLITGGKGESRTLERYFGNVLSIPYVQATVYDLRAASIESVADEVHGCVKAAATAEHFSALIDWVELQRPKPAVVKVYCKEENDEAAIVVSSGQRFPVSDLDFGWGGPVFGSYHFPWGGETGYVMPMPSADGDGAWIVYMYLMGRHLDLLEARAPHVFIPFNHTFLSLDA